MINQFSCYVVNVLKENNIVKDQDSDWYVYGTELLFITIIKFVGLFILAYMLGLIKEALVFIIAFSTLRNQAGGVHSDSFLRCLIVTNIVTFTSIFLVKYLLVDFATILVPILLILSLIIVFKYAPIDTPNRTLNDTEIQKFKRRSRGVVVIGSAIIIINLILFSSSIVYSAIAATGFFCEAVTLTPPVARRKI